MGRDPIFINIQISDKDKLLASRSNNLIKFSIESLGKIMMTDNKNQENKFFLSLKEQEGFNELALVIARSWAENLGKIMVKAESAGLKDSSIRIASK